MPVPLSGLSSVVDRTIFTNRGPIVKQPLALITGPNLFIIGPNQVKIPTGTFSLSFVGKTVQIQGSPEGRNDGTFFVSDVPNSTTLTLENSSFDSSDPNLTTSSVVNLINNIKAVFNAHVQTGGGPHPYVHGTADPGDVVTVPDAVNLASAIILLNALLAKFLNHIVLVGSAPSVHLIADVADIVLLPPATNLAGVFYLGNALRQAYELHRDSPIYHFLRDTVNRVAVPAASVSYGSGPNYGPFNWTIFDPRLGKIADDPGDVEVFVNFAEASVDFVFGLLGAIVLTNMPGPTDTVTTNYNYLNNPFTQIQRLNSSEFVLNQAGNSGHAGLPGHSYRSESSLLDPTDPSPTIKSPYQPQSVGWKYKTVERGYSAVLNDPNTLLLNVPTNRVFFPVLDTQVEETVIRYDPTSLPDQAMDPWISEGTGTVTLAPGGAGLTITDSDPDTGPTSNPPFYTHAIDLTFSSTVSAAFRVSVSATSPDGVFTGVAFGLSSGAKLALMGLLLTNANNLSSSITLVNNLAAAFDAHLIQPNVHDPNDTTDTVDVVDASDLTSLIILVNRLKALFNTHISYGGGFIHLIADSADVVTLLDATDLPSAVSLVNQLKINFNTHLTAPGIHYNNDNVNSVGLVQQIGFLTNRGFSEFDASWNSGAVNWSLDATYRLFRDVDGNVSLFASGAVVPIASALDTELPASSDIDIRLDPMQQVFFGAVGRQSTSTSKWSFIRVDVAPQDEDQIGDNKAVNYQPTVLPELDPVAPWITIGQDGFERLSAGNLVLDSTASASPSEIAALGMTTGAYRGFLRLEPILTRVASSTIQFTASVGFYTFSLDNKAAGVFIDDDTFSTWFVFLQDTPSAAQVGGTIHQPFSIASGDIAIIAIGSGEPLTIVFPVAPDISTVISTINSVVGFPLASDDGTGAVLLTDETLGASSKLRLVTGNAFQKLGLALGTYFGLDSNPEPKISWFGADFPDRDDPQWTTTGSQQAQMLGRTLRITDSSTTDFKVYTESNQLFVGPILDPSVDWKLDFRLSVFSFVAGDPVLSGSNLMFAGVLVNIDEGTQGKNVELEFAVDQFGGTYINVLSFNPSTSFLDQQTAFGFPWNDGNVHSIDLFTNKTADLCLVLVDNIALGSFSYSALHAGVIGPAITFGSGGSAVANGDLSTAQSTVDWQSVCVFRDLKVADPTAASRRFIGIYAGGDPSLLASYYTFQIDWTASHTYSIVRDPATNVSVYVDNGNIPIISINYDALRLPQSGASFFQSITGNRECISFGSFEPVEISRTIWGPIQYSIGKITITDRLIPSHEVISQANAVVSPEHLFTKSAHGHSGFNVYSGGTPSDDFLADPTLLAFTNLGEGTPPVPRTEDLQSRGGLVRTATVVETVDPLNLVDTNGFLSDLEDDLVNVTSGITPVMALVASAFAAAPIFNQHLVHPGVHLSNDLADEVSIPGIPNLSTAISLMNQVRTNYETHRVAPGVHSLNDTLFAMTAPLATEPVSLSALVVNFQTVLTEHAQRVWPHLVIDIIDLESIIAVDFSTLITLCNDLQANYNAHLTRSGIHVHADLVDISTAPACFDLSTSIAILADIIPKFNAHIIGVDAPGAPSYHKGIDRFNSDPDSVPTTLAEAISAANNLAAHFNAHIEQQESHFILDTVADSIENDFSVPDILNDSVALLNEIQSAFNQHIVQYRVHLSNDQPDAVLLSPATDLPDGIFLSNSLKSFFNDHLTALASDSGSHVHVNDDVVNTVTAANAVDLSSFVLLVDAINTAYNNHRTQPGVHGNSIFIHLDPPPRIIYQDTKFFTIVNGNPGHIAPFSDDDDGPHIGHVFYQKSQSLSYEGGSLPEQVNLVGANFAPFTIQGGDTLSLSIDTNSPIIITFQPGDTTTAAVVSRINGTAGIPANFASDNGDGRVRLTSPTAGPPSSIFISGIASIKLGLDVAQFTPWAITSDNPAAVSIQLMSVGPTDFLRYSTIGAGTRTAYISPSGLPDATSLDFDVTFSIRINTVAPDANGDTGIYVGVSGIAGPGFTAAIGFDVISNVRFVKIQDLTAGVCLFRRQFNWGDGNFHTYKLMRRIITNSFALSIVS